MRPEVIRPARHPAIKTDYWCLSGAKLVVEPAIKGTKSQTYPPRHPNALVVAAATYHKESDQYAVAYSVLDKSVVQPLEIEVFMPDDKEAVKALMTAELKKICKFHGWPRYTTVICHKGLVRRFDATSDTPPWLERAELATPEMEYTLRRACDAEERGDRRIRIHELEGDDQWLPKQAVAIANEVGWYGLTQKRELNKIKELE